MYIYQKYIYFNTKYNSSEDKKNMSLNFTLPYIKKQLFMPDLLILINKFHQQQTDSQLLKTQGL